MRQEFQSLKGLIPTMKRSTKIMGINLKMERIHRCQDPVNHRQHHLFLPPGHHQPLHHSHHHQPGQPRCPVPPEQKRLPHSHQHPMYHRPRLHSSQLRCLGRQTKTWSPLPLSPGFNHLGHLGHSSPPPLHIHPSTHSNFSFLYKPYAVSKHKQAGC